MHMHSHPALFAVSRPTSSSARLRYLFCSLSRWAPRSSSSLVLISLELIEISFLWESSQEGCVRRERRVIEIMRWTDWDQWQQPRGRSSPRGRQPPVSCGTVRPFSKDLYHHPLTNHQSPLQEWPIEFTSVKVHSRPHHALLSQLSLCRVVCDMTWWFTNYMLS